MRLVNSTTLFCFLHAKPPIQILREIEATSKIMTRGRAARKLFEDAFEILKIQSTAAGLIRERGRGGKLAEEYWRLITATVQSGR